MVEGYKKQLQKIVFNTYLRLQVGSFYTSTYALLINIKEVAWGFLNGIMFAQAFES